MTWPPARCGSWPRRQARRRWPGSPGRQLADLERRYAPAVGQGDLATRVQALAVALSADGYAASAGPAPTIAGASGEQLCQHHCPVAHVAAEFPELCEAETEAFGRLLGTPVQRLATIAHGDGICTTHVTDVTGTASRAPGRPARQNLLYSTANQPKSPQSPEGSLHDHHHDARTA